MAQNTENIEARLCDYIEGELDDQGRAEIEKHIEQNPQHQQLLQELMQTRDYVRDLPHESAPAEILESLQGQLERSGLLEPVGDDDDSELVLHVRRLPQFAAIAAMLVLAVGLAAVIYFVLPQSGDNRPEFAVAPPIPSGPDAALEVESHTDSVASLDVDAGDVFAESIDLSKSVPDPALKPAMETDVFTLAQNMGVSLPDVLAGFDGTREIFGAGNERTNATNRPVAQNRLFLVVTTPDTIAANNDVAEFLATNRMQWQTEPEAMPEPLELERMQRVLASKQRQSNVAILKSHETETQHEISAAIPPAVPPPDEAIANPDLQQPGGSVARISGQVSTAASMGETNSKRGLEGAIAMHQDARGDTQRVAPEIVVPSAEEFALQLKQAKQKEQKHNESEPVIIVRRMTKKQAADLSNTLSNRRAGQRAEMIDEDALVGVEPEFRDLTPTGRPDDFGLAGGAATQPAGPLYESDSDAKDSRIALAPTTQPLQTDPVMDRTAPSTQPASTTQPIAALDSPVDVVIVLQNSISVDEESIPATQPAPADTLHLKPLIP